MSHQGVSLQRRQDLSGDTATESMWSILQEGAKVSGHCPGGAEEGMWRLWRHMQSNCSVAMT